MGLDMYLLARKSASPHWKESDEGTGLAYWRKANAIHKWFVDNVQGGLDDCKESQVSRGQLKELVKLCKQVLKNHDLAPVLLPTQHGFFFGTQEYDDDYFEQLVYTKNILNQVVKSPHAVITYLSSW